MRMLSIVWRTNQFYGILFGGLKVSPFKACRVKVSLAEKGFNRSMNSPSIVGHMEHITGSGEL